MTQNRTLNSNSSTSTMSGESTVSSTTIGRIENGFIKVDASDLSPQTFIKFTPSDSYYSVWKKQNWKIKTEDGNEEVLLVDTNRDATLLFNGKSLVESQEYIILKDFLEKNLKLTEKEKTRLKLKVQKEFILKNLFNYDGSFEEVPAELDFKYKIFCAAYGQDLKALMYSGIAATETIPIKKDIYANFHVDEQGTINLTVATFGIDYLGTYSEYLESIYLPGVGISKFKLITTDKEYFTFQEDQYSNTFLYQAVLLQQLSSQKYLTLQLSEIVNILGSSYGVKSAKDIKQKIITVQKEISEITKKIKRNKNEAEAEDLNRLLGFKNIELQDLRQNLNLLISLKFNDINDTRILISKLDSRAKFLVSAIKKRIDEAKKYELEQFQENIKDKIKYIDLIREIKAFTLDAKWNTNLVALMRLNLPSQEEFYLRLLEVEIERSNLPLSLIDELKKYLPTLNLRMEGERGGIETPSIIDRGEISQIPQSDSPEYQAAYLKFEKYLADLKLAEEEQNKTIAHLTDEGEGIQALQPNTSWDRESKKDLAENLAVEEQNKTSRKSVQLNHENNTRINADIINKASTLLDQQNQLNKVDPVQDITLKLLRERELAKFRTKKGSDANLRVPLKDKLKLALRYVWVRDKNDGSEKVSLLNEFMGIPKFTGSRFDGLKLFAYVFTFSFILIPIKNIIFKGLETALIIPEVIANHGFEKATDFLKEKHSLLANIGAGIVTGLTFSLSYLLKLTRVAVRLVTSPDRSSEEAEIIGGKSFAFVSKMASLTAYIGLIGTFIPLALPYLPSVVTTVFVKVATSLGLKTAGLSTMDAAAIGAGELTVGAMAAKEALSADPDLSKVKTNILAVASRIGASLRSLVSRFITLPYAGKEKKESTAVTYQFEDATPEQQSTSNDNAENTVSQPRTQEEHMQATWEDSSYLIRRKLAVSVDTAEVKSDVKSTGKTLESRQKSGLKKPFEQKVEHITPKNREKDSSTPSDVTTRRIPYQK